MEVGKRDLDYRFDSLPDYRRMYINICSEIRPVGWTGFACVVVDSVILSLFSSKKFVSTLTSSVQ